MLNGVNVFEEIAEENPTSFGRNLFDEMFDSRKDLVVTDDGRHPATSNNHGLLAKHAIFFVQKCEISS